MSRLADQERFYRTLQRLEQWIGAARKLGDPMSFTDLPDRGVYFFFEPGETRSDTGRGPRVVRIGTHALKAGGRATLRQRLRSHRGTRSGSGNHRGSIFRSLVGQALLARDANTGCVSWGEKGNLSKAAVSLGQSRDVLARAEAPVEALVTRHLGRTTFLWIEINDHPGPESLRGFIERNAIALLSNYHRPVIDPRLHSGSGASLTATWSVIPDSGISATSPRPMIPASSTRLMRWSTAVRNLGSHRRHHPVDAGNL